MEKTILLAILLVSSAAYAKHNTTNPDKELYDALKVKAVDPRDPGVVGDSYQEKSVGGLVCSVTRVVYPGAEPKYSCSFKENVKPDYKAIYEALEAKEEDTSGDTDGSSEKSKIAGGLFCTHKVVIVSKGAKHSYNCAWRRTGLILEDGSNPSVTEKQTKTVKPAEIGTSKTDGEGNPNTANEAR